MKPSETVFKAILITRGRKTGKEHAVELRTVYYNNKFYFSRRDSQSDWLKNAQAIPDVQIQYNGKTFLGIAMIVTDKNLQKKFPN